MAFKIKLIQNFSQISRLSTKSLSFDRKGKCRYFCNKTNDIVQEIANQPKSQNLGSQDIPITNDVPTKISKKTASKKDPNEVKKPRKTKAKTEEAAVNKEVNTTEIKTEENSPSEDTKTKKPKPKPKAPTKKKNKKHPPDLDTSEYIDPKTIELRDTTPESPTKPAPINNQSSFFPNSTPINIENFLQEIVCSTKSIVLCFFNSKTGKNLEELKSFAEAIKTKDNTITIATVDVSDPFNLRLSESFHIDFKNGPIFYGIKNGRITYEPETKRSLIDNIPNVIESFKTKEDENSVSGNDGSNQPIPLEENTNMSTDVPIVEVGGEIKIWKYPADRNNFFYTKKLGVLVKDLIEEEEKAFENQEERDYIPKEDNEDEDEDEYNQYQSDIYFDDSEPEHGDICTFWYNAIMNSDIESLRDLAEEYGSKLEFDIPSEYFLTIPSDKHRENENTVIGTSLHIAIGNGQLDVVKYLIEEFGARIDATNTHGHGRVKSPAYTAVARGQYEILKYLKSKGANLSTLSESESETLLHVATLTNHPNDVSNKIIKYLIDEGVPLNEPEGELYYLPIHNASKSGNWKAINTLIQSGSKDSFDKYSESSALSLSLDTFANSNPTNKSNEYDETYILSTIKKLAELETIESSSNQNSDYYPKYSKKLDCCFEFLKKNNLDPNLQIKLLKTILARKYSDGYNKFPAHGKAVLNALKYQNNLEVRKFAFENTSFDLD